MKDEHFRERRNRRAYEFCIIPYLFRLGSRPLAVSPFTHLLANLLSPPPPPPPSPLPRAICSNASRLGCSWCPRLCSRPWTAAIGAAAGRQGTFRANPAEARALARSATALSATAVVGRGAKTAAEKDRKSLAWSWKGCERRWSSWRTCPRELILLKTILSAICRCGTVRPPRETKYFRG